LSPADLLTAFLGGFPTYVSTSGSVGSGRRKGRRRGGGGGRGNMWREGVGEGICGGRGIDKKLGADCDGLRGRGRRGREGTRREGTGREGMKLRERGG
jgi:hypothetical protein